MSQDPARLPIDAALVAAAQNGCAGAMHTLLAELRPLIFRYCRTRLSRFSGSVDVADDAAQETLMAIFKTLPRYREEGRPFLAWAYAIAANKVADAQRSLGRSATTSIDEVPDVAEQAPTPEEQLIEEAGLRAAYVLIQGLPERMQEVLLLRIDGATTDEIAEKLGISPGAVRVTHHRALARLRQVVGRDQPLPPLLK